MDAVRELEMERLLKFMREREEDRVWLRTSDVKRDADCALCKCCTDCNWEVRGAGYGPEWRPMCRECATDVLKGSGYLSEDGE